MIPLLASPAAQRLAWTLLHFLWQGALLGLLAWAAFALLRRQRPQLRYVAGCAFLFACLSAALATYAVLSPAPPPIAADLAPAPPIVDLQANLAPPEIATPVPTASPQDLVQILTQTLALPWRARLQPYLPWILAAWAVGVFSLSLRAAGGWFWLRRLKAAAAPIAEPEWLEALVRRTNLRRAVRFLESARVMTPMCMGLLRPVVLLPFGFFANLDPLAAEAVLAHELAHLRRLDGLVNGFQCAIEVLFFFHPAVWWISHRIRTEREHCCDDAAVLACGDAVFYAETLSRLDALRDRPPSLALSARGGNLMERLRRLLLADPPQLRFATPGLALVVALALIGSLPAQAEKPAPRSPAEEATPVSENSAASAERVDTHTPGDTPSPERLSNQEAAPFPAPGPAVTAPTTGSNPDPSPGPAPSLAPSPAPAQTPAPTPATTPGPTPGPIPGAASAPTQSPTPAPTSAPTPAPARALAPALASGAIFQAKDLAIVPGLAIRTLKVPRYPAVIVDELLTWPDKGYAVDVPAHTRASLRVTCESGEAYFRVGVADKWGNPLPGMKGSLGVPWASYANESDHTISVNFFVRTTKGYPGDGKIRVHVAAVPISLGPAPRPAEAGATPGAAGKPTLDEAHQLVRLLANQTAWGPSSNIVKLKVGELTRWNGAFTNHWPKKAEKTALVQAIPELEGWEVTFSTEPVDDQKPSSYAFQSFTVLVDKDRVVHWRTAYPWQPSREWMPEVNRPRPTQTPVTPPPPPMPPSPRH